MTVDKGIVLLAVLVGVGQGNLQIVVLELNGRIKTRLGHVLLQQIEQSPLRLKNAAVEMDGQTGIQVGVILKQVFNEFVLKGKGIEDGVVGPKFDEGAVGGLGRFYRVFGHQLPARKAHQLGFPFAKGLHLKVDRQGIYRLHPNTIESHRFFKSLTVVLGARVHFGNHIHHLSQRNTTAIVAHTHPVFVYTDFNFFSEAHHVFVDRVVHDLL